MSPSPLTKRRMIWGIMAALLVWGIYLAIGVTGVFVQRSLMDPRKSVIVFVGVGLFLALWSLVLWQQRRQATIFSQRRQSADDSLAAALPWSVPGWAGVGFGMLGLGLWVWAALSWQAVPASTTTILGWLTAGFMLGASLAGIVALSDPAPRRGKWLGYFGLLVLVGSLIVFVARMR